MDREWFEVIKEYRKDVEGENPAEYKEIFRLEQMLLAENIPYTLRENMDGWQILYPNDGKWVCSIIEHWGSYGHEDDKLEIMGLTHDKEDSVEG